MDRGYVYIKTNESHLNKRIMNFEDNIYWI